jgi:hypothetical protein
MPPLEYAPTIRRALPPPRETLLTAGCVILLAASSACTKTPEAPPDGPEATQATVSTGATPWFEDVRAEAGVDFLHDSGTANADRILFPQIMAGGAALFDLENDGDLDLYFVQAGTLDGPATLGNMLYRNDGTGRFDNITDGSGAGDTGYGMGVAAGDVDNDGLTDLYVTNVGRNALLQNRGDGTFEDITAPAGVGDPAWSTGAAFLDYDGDGDLDLYVCNYVDWARERELDCFTPAGRPDYCSPNSYEAPRADTLYRNDGDGTFTDVSADAGMFTRRGNGLGVVCGDFDHDQRIDIFVANDQMENHLWRNNGDGTFTDIAIDMGCAVDVHGEPKAGMGTVTEDVDDDDDLDLLVVNLRAQADSFFRNEGTYFIDDTSMVGLGSASRSFTRFGVGWLDFNNDGRLDLYQANGRVVIVSERTPRSEDPYAEPNMLLNGTADLKFRPITPDGGTTAGLIHTSRAAAFGDIDNDGGIDIVVVNKDAQPYILRNIVSDRGNWARFTVLDEHNRPALGAELRLDIGSRTLRRDVKSAYSYCAANDPRIHIGMGDEVAIRAVRIRWPDGRESTFGPFEANQDVTLRAPARSAP